MFSLRIYALKKERAHGMENGQGSREHDSSHAWVYGKAYVNSMSTKADFFPQRGLFCQVIESISWGHSEFLSTKPMRTTGKH